MCFWSLRESKTNCTIQTNFDSKKNFVQNFLIFQTQNEKPKKHNIRKINNNTAAILLYLFGSQRAKKKKGCIKQFSFDAAINFSRIPWQLLNAIQIIIAQSCSQPFPWHRLRFFPQKFWRNSFTFVKIKHQKFPRAVLPKTFFVYFGSFPYYYFPFVNIADCFFRYQCETERPSSTQKFELQFFSPLLFIIFGRPWGRKIFSMRTFSPPSPSQNIFTLFHLFDTLSTQADRAKNRHQRHNFPPCGPRNSREWERVDGALFSWKDE